MATELKRQPVKIGNYFPIILAPRACKIKYFRLEWGKPNNEGTDCIYS